MACTFAEFGLDRPWVAVVSVRRDPGRRDASNCFRAERKNTMAAAMFGAAPRETARLIERCRRAAGTSPIRAVSQHHHGQWNPNAMPQRLSHG
jgi:hypothetical protein